MSAWPRVCECVWEQMKNTISVGHQVELMRDVCQSGLRAAWWNSFRSVTTCAGRTASRVAWFIICFRKIYFHSGPVWHLYCQHLFPLLTCSMTSVFVCRLCVYTSVFKSSAIRPQGGPGCRIHGERLWVPGGIITLLKVSIVLWRL